MAQQSFKLDDIIDLAEELRLAGFDLGTQQYVAAQDLMIALAAHNRLPADPRNWRTLLAPVFCSSPGEQEEFYQRFYLWLKRHPELRPDKDDFVEPAAIETKLKVATRRLHRLRKPLGIATICLLIVLAMGAGYLTLNSDYTLTGQILSSEGNKPILKAQVEFFDKKAETDGEGKFSIPYRARNIRRIFNRQALLKVTHAEHEPHSHSISVHNPSAQPVTLQKLAPPSDKSSISISQPAPEATPPPIPVILPSDLLSGSRGGSWGEEKKPFNWRGLLLAASPLPLFAAWWLWRWHRRRALLQKLQAAGNPQLDRIRVKGAADLLFQSQAFRRAVQELRRHRQVAIRDLDVNSTVRATINKGGMFAPRYGSRRTSPEYLLLIDRASFGDEQARFGEEISRRLEAGGVFVDRYYFQNDPRTCRQREPHSPTLTLHELAARHPDHQLLIFSDGAGFISPLTGEPEHWLTMLGHWQRRVLLTPELAALDDYRELALAENDFVILPSTEEGLVALAEALSADVATRPNDNGQSRPFPRLILERPKRWLERHEPRPASVNELLEQLKRYLDDGAWQWLAACAVYPSLSWDVTLYLGYKLFGRTSDFEQRLLSLVRLPWFRYGTMPDWLRLRLIESFTPKQERAVRGALEELLLSALDRPREGAELEFAAPTPAEKSIGWKQQLQTLKSNFVDWWRSKRLADLIKNEPPESPLRDYVFLGFFSGGGANKLVLNLPDVLRQVLYRQGQQVLGLRTVTGLLSAILVSSVIWLTMFKPFTGNRALINTPQPIPSPTPIKLYQQMNSEEQLEFVLRQAEKISTEMGKTSYSFSGTPVAAIKPFVDDYAKRVGNGSVTMWNEDLNFVFGRGIQYAPAILHSFNEYRMPQLIGLYIPMIEVEYRPCLETPVGARGLFQFMPESARAYGIDPNDRCDVNKSAQAAARYIAARIAEFGSDSEQLTLVIASYSRSPKSVQRDLARIGGRNFWDLIAHKDELDIYFQSENRKYVPKFFAAAIVGENPQSFGLQMNPLSSYNQVKSTDNPGQAEVTQTTTTPAVQPGIQTNQKRVACQTDEDLQGQYIIRSILAREANGRTTDIGEQYPLGPLFIGKKYSDAEAKKIPGNAGPILDAEKISLSSVKTCAVLVDANECRKTTRNAKCVDVILIGGTPTRAVTGQQQSQPQVPSGNNQQPDFVMAQSPNGKILAIASGNKVKLVDASTKSELVTLEKKADYDIEPAHTSDITEVKFSPDGKFVATASMADKRACIWEVNTGKFRLEFRVSRPEKGLFNFDVSPDGRMFADSFYDGAVLIRDFYTGFKVAEISTKDVSPLVRFSPEGKSLAVAADNVRIYDSTTGKILLSLQGNKEPITKIEFSSDGASIQATRLNGAIDVWDLRTGKLQGQTSK